MERTIKWTYVIQTDLEFYKHASNDFDVQLGVWDLEDKKIISIHVGNEKDKAVP